MSTKVKPEVEVDEVSQWFEHILCDQFVEQPLTALFAETFGETQVIFPEVPPESQEADLFRTLPEPPIPFLVLKKPVPDVLQNWCVPLDFFKRILVLLRQVYVGIPRGHWSIKAIPASKDKNVYLSVMVDDQYEVRIVFSKDASVAMLVDHKPGLGVQMRSLERMALRNDCWTDFEGWINLSKTTLNRLWETAEGQEPSKEMKEE